VVPVVDVVAQRAAALAAAHAAVHAAPALRARLLRRHRQVDLLPVAHPLLFVALVRVLPRPLEEPGRLAHRYCPPALLPGMTWSRGGMVRGRRAARRSAITRLNSSGMTLTKCPTIISQLSRMRLPSGLPVARTWSSMRL